MSEEAQEVVLGIESQAILAIGRPTLSAPDYMIYPVRIASNGLAASCLIGLQSFSQSLNSYFRDLALNWRGWAGAKDWSTYERDLSMSAVHDGKGLIVLSVTLGDPFDAAGGWQAHANIPLEPGALERIAEGIESLMASHDIGAR